MRQPRKDELAEWGEAALKWGGPMLTRWKDKLVRWREPRARMLRQRRRARVATTTGAVATGTFGVGSFATFSPQMMGAQLDEFVSLALNMSGFGLGGLTVVAGAGTVGAGVRYRRLKRIPLPDAPPEPVDLPPQGSEAREPMRRLRDAEQSLHGALTQLTTAGIGAPRDSVAGTRATADSAAAALRGVSARLVAVESAIPHAPEADRATLRDDVRRLRGELDEGVDSYGGLVAAASRAVAASGAGEQTDLLQDATDRLAGLASALEELSGTSSRTGDAAVPAERRETPEERDAGRG